MKIENFSFLKNLNLSKLIGTAKRKVVRQMGNYSETSLKSKSEKYFDSAKTIYLNYLGIPIKELSA